MSLFFSILFIVVPPLRVSAASVELSRCALGVSSEKIGISMSKFSPDSLTI